MITPLTSYPSFFTVKSLVCQAFTIWILSLSPDERRAFPRQVTVYSTELKSFLRVEDLSTRGENEKRTYM